MGRTHHSMGLWWSHAWKVPSWGSRCLEEGAEGELCPRAGAACSLRFCPPFPLGALWETRSRAKLKPKGPHSLQESPLEQGAPGTGDIQGQRQPGTSPRRSPAPGWGCSLACPQTPGGLQHHTPEAGPQQKGAAPGLPVHPPAMLTLPGLLSFPRCFSCAFST